MKSQKKQISKEILVDKPILKVLSSQVIGEEETYLVAKVFMKNLAFSFID